MSSENLAYLGVLRLYWIQMAGTRVSGLSTAPLPRMSSTLMMPRVGLHHAHGEIAGHFLGEFADAVDSGVQDVAHVGEFGSFGESTILGVVEVVIAHHVIVFDFFYQADIAEKGLEGVDVFEVIEVEDFFHGGGVLVEQTN